MWPATGFSSSAQSASLRSGPTRLNFASPPSRCRRGRSASRTSDPQAWLLRERRERGLDAFRRRLLLAGAGRLGEHRQMRRVECRLSLEDLADAIEPLRGGASRRTRRPETPSTTSGVAIALARTRASARARARRRRAAPDDAVRIIDIARTSVLSDRREQQVLRARVRRRFFSASSASRFASCRRPSLRYASATFACASALFVGPCASAAWNSTSAAALSLFVSKRLPSLRVHVRSRTDRDPRRSRSAKSSSSSAFAADASSASSRAPHRRSRGRSVRSARSSFRARRGVAALFRRSPRAARAGCRRRTPAAPARPRARAGLSRRRIHWRLKSA